MIPCDVYDITKLIFCIVVMIYYLHRNINRLSYTGRKCRRCLAKGFDLYRELGRLKVFDGGRGESGGIPPFIFLRRPGLHTVCVVFPDSRLFYDGG